jgi:hypothetical protein
LKSPSPQIPREKIQQHLEVNLFGATIKARSDADRFIPQMASIHCAGKSPLQGFSDAFSCEVGVQIHVAFAKITPAPSTRADQVAQVILAAATDGTGHL